MYDRKKQPAHPNTVDAEIRHKATYHALMSAFWSSRSDRPEPALLQRAEMAAFVAARDCCYELVTAAAS